MRRLPRAFQTPLQRAVWWTLYSLGVLVLVPLSLLAVPFVLVAIFFMVAVLLVFGSGEASPRRAP